MRCENACINKNLVQKSASKMIILEKGGIGKEKCAAFLPVESRIYGIIHFQYNDADGNLFCALYER